MADVYATRQVTGRDPITYTVKGGRIVTDGGEDITRRLSPEAAVAWTVGWQAAVGKPREERLAAYDRIAGEGRGPADLKRALAEGETDLEAAFHVGDDLRARISRLETELKAASAGQQAFSELYERLLEVATDLASSGKPATAGAILQRLADVNPTDPTPVERLAVIYAAAGQPELASALRAAAVARRQGAVK